MLFGIAPLNGKYLSEGFPACGPLARWCNAKEYCTLRAVSGIDPMEASTAAMPYEFWNVIA
jgi:hypothetical protein